MWLCLCDRITHAFLFFFIFCKFSITNMNSLLLSEMSDIISPPKRKINVMCLPWPEESILVKCLLLCVEHFIIVIWPMKYLCEMHIICALQRRKWCSVRLGNLLKVLHQVNCVANVLLSYTIVVFPLNLTASQVLHRVVEKTAI